MKATAKGKRLEYDLAKSLRESKLDTTAMRMARSGAIETLESDILTQLPILIEAKNQETWKPMEYYRQACNGAKTNEIPVVVMKKNNEKPLALLSWDDFIQIMIYAKAGGWTQELQYSKRRQVGK